ncbi:MAG: ATPase [Vulcanisaeta sp.]|nr:ATPase [Vulcanisaeta sp.]MCG2892323.1 ATPase [Vulcanisaeta sp.]
MPIARLVEYKIALPPEYAFDLLMIIGNTNMFMPITRPGSIPAPRIPSKYSERIRRLEDISRELGRVLSQYSIPPPQAPREVKVGLFSELLEYALEDGEDLLTRVRQYLSSIEGIRGEYERLKGIVDVVSAVGEVVMERLRHFSVDIVPIGEEDYNEFRNAVVNYGSEVIPVKVQERLYVLVIYPEWARQNLLNVYKLFNTAPLELPAGLDLKSARERLVELEGKLARAEQEFREFLLKVSDRAYSIIDISEAVMRIVRQYTESAIPEGREVGEKMMQMVRSINELRDRIRELEAVRAALEYMVKTGLELGGLSRLRSRVFVVRGVNESVTRGLMHIRRDVEGTDLSIIALIEPPSDFDKSSLGREVYEISQDYIANAKSAYELTGRELTDLRARLRELEKEYEDFVREFNEVSAYGVEGIDKVSGDVVTIAGYVKEDLSGKFDDMLSSLLTKLAVDARVRKESKVAYIKEIDPEKAPTLEEYPKPIDAFKKITYMYGVPKYTEVSPVPLTFILFSIFYGWMYPDLGHGIVLSLFGYLLYKSRYKGSIPLLRSIFGGKYSDWGLIFLMAGLWSVVFTFVESGTIFGIEVLPAPLRLVHVTESNALEILTDSVYAVLAMSIMVGIAALLLSFALKALNAYRGGERDLALGFYVPLFFFFLFLVLALGSANFVPFILLAEQTTLFKPLYGVFNAIKGLMMYWAYATIAFFAILMASMMHFRAKYRGVPGFSLTQLAVEIGAETAIPSLTNTISFMRLGIIAIMHAVFTAMTYAWASSLGLLTPAGIAVLVVFNLLIILGEGFVAFVQSLRLHYYEMYSKFFSGAGVLFMPFTLGLRWVTLSIL